MIKRLRTTHPLFLILVLTFFSVALFPHNSLAAKPAIKRVDPALKKALAEAVADAKSFDDQFEAEVWLVDMSARLKRFIKDPQERLTLLRMVHQEAKRADLSPELVISVIHVESAFNPYAVSYVGAQGLMQVMPFWKKELGRTDDNLINMAVNLRYGCTILKHYLKREKGDWIRALARYNGSLGRTKYPEKVMNFWQKYWFVDHQ
ncbi:MAG: soluble lytic murein transglycosylase-like protein [Oleispira sp.]|jgi:soluble lytic murein transglycosylase-like protein|tara:strand:+ start:923 stop:1537 length:615 start_codon:yes stop_codon:yes gene_type:complete